MADVVSTENYRLQSAYEKNLIIKMVLVSVVLCFGIYSANSSSYLITPGISVSCSFSL